MASPSEIQAQLERGWSVFLDMKSRDIEKAKGGCGCCGDSLTQCLFLINTGLQWRVDQGVYDDTSDKLYTDMMEIIGAGAAIYGPTVDAGPNITITQPTDYTLLNGSVTAGTNPITGTMWTQISGPNQANIDTPTSTSTQVDGMVPGTYVFKLTAIDSIGKIGSDTTTVTMIAANMIAYFWNQDTNVVPSRAEILGKSTVEYVSGQPIVIPFVDDGGPKFSGVAYLAIEPIKTQWADVVEFWNNGVVGTPGDLFSSYTIVSEFRVTITQYGTQFQNNIRFQ